MTPPPRIWHGEGWELRVAHDSRACYRPHLHDALSIGHVLSGRSTSTIAGRAHALAAGSVVTIRARVLHACNPAAGPWSYRMLHIEPAWLAAQGGHEPADCVLHAPHSAARTRAFDAFAHVAEQGTGLACDEALAHLLALCAVDPAAVEATPRALQRAFDYLRAHACDTVRLEALARQAGASPWQVLRGFQRHFGATPHALQQGFRIHRARRWLRHGASLADVAVRAGFTDQAHFSHIFKKHTALTPGAYRKASRPD
ncbi:MAG: AraC family transcriptional regulator [Rhodocyclaceae bacterium]